MVIFSSVIFNSIYLVLALALLSFLLALVLNLLFWPALSRVIQFAHLKFPDRTWLFAIGALLMSIQFASLSSVVKSALGMK